MLNRKDVISRRRSMDVKERRQKSDVIIERLLADESVSDACNWLVYVSASGEVITDGLIEYLLREKKKVYAPVSDAYGGMEFYRIRSMDDLVTGLYGIREPKPDYGELYKGSEQPDRTVIIVPGVIFDKNCNRMGYGKGYYDRYLSRFPVSNRIGLAYEFQIDEALAVNEWDIPMTRVITEERILVRGEDN